MQEQVKARRDVSLGVSFQFSALVFLFFFFQEVSVQCAANFFGWLTLTGGLAQHRQTTSHFLLRDYECVPVKQVHILGVGLAVHEKLVHPEMRPLHKKLVDQFHMMRTGLHHVSSLFFPLNPSVSLHRSLSYILSYYFTTPMHASLYSCDFN